jgi:hypothetical protein
MRKTIILTERDLTILVKRIIKEHEIVKNNEKDKGFVGGNYSLSFAGFKKAVNAARDFFKNEVFSDITDKELAQILSKSKKVNVKKLINKIEDEKSESISEGYINEGIIDRIKDFVSTLGIYAGGLTSAAALISIAGEVSGWSQSRFFTKIHEINQEFMGLGRGNATMALLVMVLGIILACYSYSKRETKRETSK